MVSPTLVLAVEIIAAAISTVIVVAISKTILESNSYVFNMVLVIPQALGVYLGLKYFDLWWHPVIRFGSIGVIILMVIVSIIKTAIFQSTGHGDVKTGL